MGSKHVIAWDVGIKNLAFCRMASDGTVTHWKKTEISYKNLSGIPDELMRILRAVPESLDVSVCIIERQPKKRLDMLTIMIAIMTLYRAQGIPVILFPAYRKFQKTPKTYTERKQESIRICREVLSDDLRFLFDQVKKKDDLSDAFLMCRCYLGIK